MKANRTLYRGHTARILALEGLLSVLVWLLPAAAQAQAIQAWVQLSDPYGYITGAVLALDASGNVVVSGGIRDPATSDMDWLTMKYSSAGVPAWTNRYSGPVWGDQPHKR